MARHTPLRTTRIELRCTPDERQRWEALARARGCSLSVLIRGMLDAKLASTPSTDPALLRQIAAIGNNLNQVARWANTYKSTLQSQEVLAELHEIQKELARLQQVKSC